MSEKMNTYIVAFRTDSKDIKAVSKWRNKIDCYPAWAMLNNNTYLIVSSAGIKSITEHFADLLGNENSCFVAKIVDDAAWAGYPTGVSKWIKDNTKK